jgi:phosphatidylserine/phosphatidylglycerophosphate/cardiolipin synthase-like enzyme/sarcosine oxidase gamma subunit
MAKRFMNMATFSPRSILRTALQLALVALFSSAGVSTVTAQEKIFFPSRENAEAQIVSRIQAETVRIDIALWLLDDGDIMNAILSAHAARPFMPIRVMGDRAGIFESDPNTRASFEKLANAGIPIRLRYNPTWFPEILHWKCGIYVGQNMATIGSANWTSFELKPVSATNYKDETVMLTDDSAIVQALMTKFDQFWADTTYFLDWPEAYKRETGITWVGTKPMTVDRTRLVPDYPTDNLIWGQGIGSHPPDGPNIIDPMIAEINAETAGVDLVSYRMTVPTLTDALIKRKQAGVPVRVFVEPTQYRSDKFPEYWLVGNETDKLWVAGIPIKIRTHAGLTHMKTLITSRSALLASSNYTKNWQRDHNYFITVAEKPALYTQMKDEFERMWNDTTNYTDFTPLTPRSAVLSTPVNNDVGVTTLPKLVWNRAPWAVAFDVYLGTTTSNMTRVARVGAVLNEDPPQTYSYTVSQALQPSTKYFWKVVSRTFATDVNPALIATSSTWSFTTAAGSGGGGTSGPFSGTPVALPGTVQAEDFDNGGSGVAYFDTSASNEGGKYRTTTAVDIESTADTGGGYDVGWTAPGEWLNYTVNVTTAGTYTIEARVAAAGTGGTFHIEVNGVDKTGPLSIPNTGDWQRWTTISKTNVSLSAGVQVWRVVFDTTGPGGVLGNLNYVRLTTGSGGGGGTGPTPYGGTAVALPGTVQAENFDEGGAGVAYSDTSAANEGGQYRSTAVDIETSTEGGYDVGWIAPGEWLKYTVNVTAAGTYDLEFRVAASGSGGTFHLEVGTTNVTGPLTIPNTGGWQTWTTVKKTGVSLAAGSQVWRVVFDANGASGAVGNLNYIRVASGSSTTGPTPFGGTAWAIPGRIEIENFDEGAAGAAYADTSPGNAGGRYRTTDVDIENSSDTGGGYNVGWADRGEWLRYSVNIGASGVYNLDVRVASAGTGGTFHVEVNGVNVSGSVVVPNTGGWQAWRTIRVSGITLTAGAQVLRVVMDTVGSTTGATGNFNWLSIQP